jgi:hypothetical protein
LAGRLETVKIVRVAAFIAVSVMLAVGVLTVPQSILSWADEIMHER